MPRADIEEIIPIPPIPSICTALDQAVRESEWTSRGLAEALDVDESTVSRWRTGVIVPDRDTVLLIEAAISPERPVGFISRMAGYVDDQTGDLVEQIRQHPKLTKEYRDMMATMLEAAFKSSAVQIKAQKSRRPRR